MTSPWIRLVQATVFCALGLSGVAVEQRGMTANQAAGIGQRPAVFKSQVDLVRVDALVTRDGRPVAGLTAADFELRDEGVVQTIVDASLEQVPLDVLFVLDRSGSITEANAGSLRDAAVGLLAGLTSMDRAGLLTFNARVHLAQPLTADTTRLRARLAEIQGEGPTALHDAVYTALRLREPAANRGALVVFTDGVDNVSWLSSDEVLSAARQSDVIVHVVVVTHPGAEVSPADNRLLKDLARDTGGRVWNADWGPKLEEAFRAVLDDLRSRYVLTYYPSGVPETGWHRIEVRLSRGGKVTARAGYFRWSGRR